MTTTAEDDIRVDQTIRLADGRTLGYAEYGDPDGDPLLFFPGTPGSRCFIVPEASVALDHEVRILVVDRPGYGLSTLEEGLELLDWPGDVVQLLNALDIEDASVAGHSGGGAFVLACAHEIPDRLVGAGLISSVAPFHLPEIGPRMSAEEQHIGEMVDDAPEDLREFAERIFGDANENPEAVYEAILADAPAPDRAVLEREEIRTMMCSNIAEAFRQGPVVWAHESELFFRPWGFDLASISMNVHLWQGEQDSEVPPFMGRYLAEALPDCSARFSPDDGHTIFATHWEEILATLTSSD